MARRVVTGVGDDGRSLVATDGNRPPAWTLDAAAGMSLTTVWDVPGSPPDPQVGGDPEDPPRFLVDPGTGRSIEFTVPPDAARQAHGVEALVAEITRKLPDLLTTYDPARGPGMHRTNTVDVLMVVTGTPVLALEAEQVTPGPGDWVVQRATWHAWRKPGAETAVLCGVMIGCGP